MKRTAAKSVDAYIATYPKDVQAILQRIRAAIRKAAPGAVEEKISYQIPAFTLDGRYLVYMAAFRNHIGIYPVPAGSAAFKNAVAPYRSGKATVKLPLDQPVPFGLIDAMVKLRAKENLERAKAKSKARKTKRPKTKARKTREPKPKKKKRT